MGNKGQLVVRYAGDTRDLEKANQRGIKDVKDFGSKASTVAKAAGKSAGRGFGDGFGGGAKQAGKTGAEGFGASLKLGAAAAAAAAGVGAAAVLADAMAKEKLNDKIAASLNLTAPQAKKAGKVASELYAGAWGDSMPDVTDAVESVMSSIDGMAKASPKQLSAVTAGVMDIATAFELDASSEARNLGILIKTGLAKDATTGLDLITRALQKVPKAMRGDVSDAVEEYGQFFADVGFSGSESMKLLVSATEDGKYGIDKMGDAIKEFTIRASDGSTSTRDSFGEIGLNANWMADRFLKGGDTAKEAFDKTIKGLLDIKDPSRRAAAAIGLFGTPLEDLGTEGIPKFLESLLEAEGGLGKTKDAAKKMGDTLNDNVATRLESAKRQAQLFVTDGLMALWDGFDTGKAKGDGFAGSLSEAGAALKPIADAVKDISEIPGFSKFAGRLLAIGAAVVTLNVAYKFSGLSFLASNLIPTLGDNAKEAAIKLGPLVFAAAALADLTAEVNKQHPEESGWMTFIKAPWRGFTDGLKSTKDLFKGIGDFLGDIEWGEYFDDMFRDGKNLIKGLGNGIASGAHWLDMKIREIGTKVINWFKDVFGIKSPSKKTEKMGKQLVTGLMNGLKEMPKRIAGKFGDILGGARKAWDRIKETVSDKARGMSEKARSSFSNLKEKASSIWSSLGQSLRNTGQWINDHVFAKFRDGLGRLKDAFRSARDGIGDIWNGLKKLAARPINFVLGTVYNEGIRGWIGDIFDFFGKSNPLPKASLVNFAQGSEDHRAQIARPGAMRLWAEPETGGEAYIPLASSKRSRSTSILADVASRFGYGLQKYADGGFSFGIGDALKMAGDTGGWIKDKFNGLVSDKFAGKSGGVWDMMREIPGAIIGGLGSFAKDKLGGLFGGLFGGGSGKAAKAMGWENQWAAVKGAFPSANLNSAYRPGAITAVGTPSYHGMGRAIDVSPSMDIFNWIAKTFPFSTELIYSPAGARQLYKGQKTLFGEPTRGDHWDHVHWAMANGGILKNAPVFDNGGILGTGLNLVNNATGRPERLGPAGGPIYLTIEIGGKRLGELVVDPIREQVRTKGGGDVQAYLGRGRR